MARKTCERLVRIEVLLTEDERHAFRIAAVADRTSMRTVSRRLIREWLKRRQQTTLSDST